MEKYIINVVVEEFYYDDKRPILEFMYRFKHDPASVVAQFINLVKTKELVGIIVLESETILCQFDTHTTHIMTGDNNVVDFVKIYINATAIDVDVGENPKSHYVVDLDDLILSAKLNYQKSPYFKYDK